MDPRDPSDAHEPRRGENLLHRIGLRGALRLGRALREADRSQDLDADAPEIVMLDDTSRAILEHAMDLACDDREDAEAVAELVRRAGRNRRALEVAALAARQWGAHHDYSVNNRAHRLLQAALTGSAVAPARPSDLARFEVLDAFDELDADSQWAALVAKEPRLVELDREAAKGTFGTRESTDRLIALKGEAQRAAARESLERHELLDRRLIPIIGPKSGTADTLVSSRVAYEAAWHHLTNPADASPASQ